MAELVTKQNIIELFQWFANQTDQRYILETVRASANTKGGIKIGDGLYMEGDTLNCTVTLSGGGDGVSYILQPASESELGGIRPGTGVSMRGSYLDLTPADTNNLGGIKVGVGLEMRDGFLDVTLTGGDGAAVADFTGATANTEGKSGLVPKPARGDQAKFLRADGKWVTVNEYPNTLTADVAGIQGALWQDVVGDTPCLKFRYGDYEYNFYGERKLLGSDAPQLDTSQPGKGYILSQAVSTSDGGLWYELRDGKPTLKLRQGSFEFAYKYNSVTYKGSSTDGLISYVDCDRLPMEDACVDSDMASLTSANIYVADSAYANLYQKGENVSAENPATPLFGNAFTANPGVAATIKLAYDATILPIKVNATTQAEYTTDCWFFFNEGIISLAKTKNANQFVLNCITVTPSGNLSLSYGTFTNPKKQKYNAATFFPAKSYANKPHHLAITCKMINGQAVSNVALDGNFIITAYGGQLTIFKPGTQYSFSEYVAFNKIRWFNKVFWEDDFEPPKPNAYY